MKLTNLYPVDKHLQLLFERFDPVGDGHSKFEDFKHALTPFMNNELIWIIIINNCDLIKYSCHKIYKKLEITNSNSFFSFPALLGIIHSSLGCFLNSPLEVFKFLDTLFIHLLKNLLEFHFFFFYVILDLNYFTFRVWAFDYYLRLDAGLVENVFWRIYWFSFCYFCLFERSYCSFFGSGYRAVEFRLSEWWVSRDWRILGLFYWVIFFWIS